MHLQPCVKGRKVGRLREACGGVHGEARGRDDACAAAEQLESDVKANLDARARDEEGSPREIGGLKPLRMVEGGARRAQPRVKVVQLRVALLANVARRRVVQLVGLLLLLLLLLLELLHRWLPGFAHIGQLSA